MTWFLPGSDDLLLNETFFKGANFDILEFYMILAVRLRGIKQGINDLFLLCYFLKPQSQVRILICW